MCYFIFNAFAFLLIEHINLRVELPEGEEILVLNYRVIPIMNDNDSLQNCLLCFIQTPLEKLTAPPLVELLVWQVQSGMAPCTHLVGWVVGSPTKPFVGSSVPDFTGFEFMFFSSKFLQ